MTKPDDTVGGRDGTRLDQIATQWSLLRLAHQHTVTTAGPARNALVLRYAKAIRGYVGALIREEQDADEVAQEVLVRLLRGDFGRADPQRGRFRDLLRVAVRNLVRNHYNSKNRRAGVDYDVTEVADGANDDSLAEQDLSRWRQSVLQMAWDGLEDYQHKHAGSVAHTVLRLRADYPDDDSEQLAARLSKATGKVFRADAARQQLHRARSRFAELLLEEIARTLDQPTPEQVQEELIELGLMDYVRDFLPTGES